MLIGIYAVVADAQIEELHSHRLGRVCNAVARDMSHVCANWREVDEGLRRFDEIVIRPPPGALRESHIPRFEARTSIHNIFHATLPQLDPERQPQELELGELQLSQKRQEVRLVHLSTLVRQAVGVIEPLPERGHAADGKPGLADNGSIPAIEVRHNFHKAFLRHVDDGHFSSSFAVVVVVLIVARGIPRWEPEIG